MADAGDLEKLPPEIRNEIYALVLVPAEPLALCNYGDDQNKLGEPSSRRHDAPKMKNEWARTDKLKVAPVDHMRNFKGRGHKYVKGKWVEVPSNIALLCVNKKIHLEAVPVLYGRTKFRFQNANTMRRFVNSIGNNIQYLCDIGVSAGGWEYRRGFNSARVAIEALVAAKNIHTFEVSHVDVCPNVSSNMRGYLPGSNKVVRLCKSLLDSLGIAYKANGIKASILEVIKISVANHREPGFYPFRDCDCENDQAAKANAELQRELKRSIAEQHGLKFES